MDDYVQVYGETLRFVVQFLIVFFFCEMLLKVDINVLNKVREYRGNSLMQEMIKWSAV